MSDRKIALAFDAETGPETAIEVGIPQGSPISPILFLIYIRFLFNINMGEIRLEDAYLNTREVSSRDLPRRRFNFINLIISSQI